MKGLLTVSGLSVFVALGSATLHPDHRHAVPRNGPEQPNTVSLLAVGDINLGRNVGQQILRGDTLYPFAHVRADFAHYDVVFGNLECPLTDQKGETQSPYNNLIFTGPPAGASSLSRAGMTLVSTANNHALDYGIAGLTETLDHLGAAGILSSGTSLDAGKLYQPVLLEVKGIRFAFFACTDIMNIEDRSWTRFVAEADSGKLFPAIRACRQKADIIILSYHGGEEYAAAPTIRTRRFARAAIRSGVDLFLGHHPHVPQEIEQLTGGLIVYSLGNFVFRQPFEFWAQRSFALEVMIQGKESGAAVAWYHCKPLLAGDQPELIRSTEAYQLIRSRTRGTYSDRERGDRWYD